MHDIPDKKTDEIVRFFIGEEHRVSLKNTR